MRFGDREINIVAFTGEAKAPGQKPALRETIKTGRSVGLNLASDRSRLIAVLQSHQTARMDSHIHINGICIERLPKDQHRFFVGIARGVGECNVSREFDVAGHFLPRELKFVVHGPHILAAAGQGVRLFSRIVSRGAGVQDCPNIRVILKNTDWILPSENAGREN